MEYIVSAVGLKKSFGSKKAVAGIDLAVAQGETFGLLGANGAGKSTTVECLVGVKEPDEGQVLLMGKRPRAQRKTLFEHVGVQFQESRYQDKVKVDELCRMTACLYRQPADYRALLHSFGLDEKRSSFIEDLSGGQKQRLFVALALIPDPRLVFLDELTTGLDVKTRREVWGYLEAMKDQGVTIFLTSHYLDEVERLCDRIAIIRNGRIVFTGTVDEARESCGTADLEQAYLHNPEQGSKEAQ
ncbi:MAG: ABC transporter ATP-binding protein [Gordonibacter sp.]